MPKLIPPPNGVAIRMYRQGHGDCFLLAFPRTGSPDPVYVLIDCGYKPGSPAFVHDQPISATIDHIGESTDNHLDLVVITHEHQDHLNGIWKKTDPYFGPFTIDKAWMAWTEKPDDPLAIELRKRHKDQLLGLVAARNRLALATAEDDPAVTRLTRLIEFELGFDIAPGMAGDALLAAADPAKSVNKQGLKLIKDKAEVNRGVSYLNPGDGPLAVPGTSVSAFVLGPPRDEDLLTDEDPRGDEGFPDDDANGFTFAVAAAGNVVNQPPLFGSRYIAPFASSLSDTASFFSARYGSGSAGEDQSDRAEALDNPPWRRIDNEWLYSAEMLALQLNTGINNTSLVLAFELPTSKKVLLFAADAQRGNWISWTDNHWSVGGKDVTVRDLLGRTVLYKVGHHGSHNATLNGTTADTRANLSWMATGAAASEFTAMITAVTEWAMTKNDPPWRHPLPSIKEALLTKADGRVFQTDTDDLIKPNTVPDAAWNAFLTRCKFEALHFDYQVIDA